MYVGRYRPGVPASGTRDRRLRGYLVSFARCLRVETDLAAAVLLSVLNLDQSMVLVPETQESQSSVGDGEESQSSDRWLNMDGADESDPPPTSRARKDWNLWNDRRYKRRDARKQGVPLARPAARSRSDAARRIAAEAARMQAQEREQATATAAAADIAAASATAAAAQASMQQAVANAHELQAELKKSRAANYRARKGTYSVQYCYLLSWAFILGLYTNIRWLEQAIQVCKLKRRASSQDPLKSNLPAIVAHATTWFGNAIGEGETRLGSVRAATLRFHMVRKTCF